MTGTPGRRVVLVFDSKLSPSLINNTLFDQVSMVQGNSDPALPASLVANLDVNGQFTFQAPLTAAMSQRNIYAQAAIGAGQNLRLSNVVNVYVNTR